MSEGVNSESKSQDSTRIVSLLNKEISLSKKPIEDVLGDERVLKIPSEDVIERGKLLLEAFGGGEEELKKLEGYRVIVAPDDLYGRLGYSDIQEDFFSGIESAKDLVSDALLKASLLMLKRIDSSAGVCNKKEKLIVVRKAEDEEAIKRTIDHELLHAMADRNDGGSGFQRETEDSHDLNEAMVEIMEMSNTYNKSARELAEALVNGEIELVENRMEDVAPLLSLMVIAAEGEESISIRKMAKYYWKGDEDSLLSLLSDKVKTEREAGLSQDILELLSKLNDSVKT